ncbi:sodium/hydrogen exchanger 9B2-like [Diadema antillarum]|uniref:sodium/hydrogen exchanger 9B2-like n=1 Tax=Diadema antillarum TaxID=105358 RepID=UPI003A8A84FB
MSGLETVNPWSSRQPPPSQLAQSSLQDEDGLSMEARQLSEQQTLEFDRIGSSRSDRNASSNQHKEDTGESSAIHGADAQQKSQGCQKLLTLCLRVCKPCLTEFNPLPQHASRCDRLKYAFMCPPHGCVSQWMLLLLTVTLTWAVLWSVTGAAALPGGNLFALFVLVVACKVGGALVELIKLPALLGMLIVGFLLRNIPVINVAEDINPEWSSSLRAMALVIILLQAGIGLDAGALKRLSIVCVRLCCLPCIAEACTAAVVSHFLLGFPWPWGFMLGFVLGAVTPAVIVPSLLALQSKGYGVRQGIPTLVIAAASCDDVLAIGAFGVILGAAFATGNLVYSIFRGPLELLMGVLYGGLAGLLLWFLPDSNQTWLTRKRFLLLIYGGTFAIFGSGAAHFPGAGALGCLTMAFIAGHRWKAEKEAIDQMLSYVWILFEPLLFGLIGAEVAISYLDPATVGLGLVTLLIGLFVRMVISGLAVTRAGLTLKEKCFISLAWLPKATVQAAIGSVALDTARERGAGEEFETYGIQLLTVAVLSILITAPLGAIAISLTGPLLLRRDPMTAGGDGNRLRDDVQSAVCRDEEASHPRYEETRREDASAPPQEEQNVLLEEERRDENAI